jgi:hypothetical protein
MKRGGMTLGAGRYFSSPVKMQLFPALITDEGTGTGDFACVVGMGLPGIVFHRQ